MSELSPEARRFLALEDDVDATPADEARVRERLEVELGVALPVAALAASATAHALAASAAATSGAAAITSAGASGASVASAAAGGATAATVTGAAAVASGAVAGGATSVLTLVVAGVVAVAAGAGLTTAAFRVTQPGPAVAVQAPVAASPAPPVTKQLPAIEVDSDVVVQPSVEVATSDGADEPAAPEALAPEAAEPASETTAASGVVRPAAHAPKPVGRSGVPSGPVTPGVPVGETPAPGSGAAVADGLPPPPLLASERQAPALPVPDHCDRLVELKHIDAAETALLGAEPAAALAQLEGYYRTCPTGEWHPRAWLIRTGSLCSAGRLQEAAALIDWYESEHPVGDELLQRARTWCPDSVFVRHESARETEPAE